jgi:hypothetical protein
MSSKSLNDRTKQELATLARRRGVKGWEAMKKDQLVKALARAAAKASVPAIKATSKTSLPVARPSVKAPVANTKVSAKPVTKVATPVNGAARHVNGSAKAAPLPVKPAAKPAAVSAKPAAKAELAPRLPVKPAPRAEFVIPADKDLSSKTNKAGGAVKDRIVVTSPDPYWLHAFWELSLQSVQRAEAALGQDWHGARPIIRLFDVTSADTTSTSERPLRDIVVHGGCTHWYIDVPQPPQSYRADIGYLSRRGQFYVLARSNVIMPPKAGASEAVEEGLGGEARTDRPNADPMQQAQQMLDEQFRKPLIKDTAFGSGALPPGKLKKFFFDIDAELIVRGQTDPGAAVTLQNEPVKLTPDGRFTMRFSLPDSRQIIPAVATAADGMEEQTIVLAVERNTKRLDPMIHDLYGEN